MTKLSISIASNDTQSSDFQNLDLECTRPGLYAAPCTFVAEVTKRIHYADYTTVYRANLKVIDGDATHDHDVVLKTDFFSKSPRPNDFEHEADVYHSLADIQGDAVPVFLGLFQGTDGDKRVSVLITEYCGEDFSWDRENISNEFRQKVMQKLYIIHRCGFQHGDLSRRNIVLRDGEPFFIDFEHAKHHDCEIRQHVILGHNIPGPAKFGCTELWRFGRNLGAWADTTVSVRAFGRRFKYSRYVVSRDVLDIMVEGVACQPHEEYQRQQIREALEKLVDDVERWRETCAAVTPDEMVLKPDQPLVLIR